MDGLKEVVSKFFVTIKNVYNFFTLYANTDKLDPKNFFVDYKDRAELDRWILSKYNNLKKAVEEDMEIFELTRAVRRIQDFANEDLSNWYIRRSRRRFWDTQLTEDKKAVYNTTYEVLVGLAQMIAPFAPFISEEIYKNLTGELSVHLSDYPKVDMELIDERVEQRMDLVRSLVTLGRAARESARIKVRQPLQEIFVDGKYEELISDLVPLIREELNIKDVVFADNLDQYMDFTIKPNFRVLGPVLGPRIKDFQKALSQLDTAVVAPMLDGGESYTIDLDGQPFEINSDNVLITIAAKEGFNVVMENNLFVILDTTISPELRNEGYAREFISKIQQMRKNNNYEVMDNIRIFFDGDEEITKAVKLYEDYIKNETLAVIIEKTSDSSMERFDLNDHDTGIMVEKV